MAMDFIKRFKLDSFLLPLIGIGAVLLIPPVAMNFMPLFWFAAKAGFLLFLFIWVRGTLPRFRYDQLMRFAWTFLFPVAVINLFITGLAVALESK